jgi:hypothetical protein
LNLAARDFDAYAPEKATSNAYSRPRLELKQRALVWARAIVARLAELGITVDVHGSDEHPSLRNRHRVDCQWVFFSRDQAARDELDRLLDRGRSIAAEIDDPSPFTRHAFFALRLDAATVEVCFAVHPQARVDVDNLRVVLDGAADELVRAIRALPEQFTVGVSRGERSPAAAVTIEALRALVDRAALGEEPLWIGWSIGRDTAVEHSGLLDEQLEDALVALAPIYRMVAWSRDNDRIALDRHIESAEQERARLHAEAEAQTERWRVEQAEAHRSAAEQARARAPAHESAPPPGPRPPRKPSLDTLFKSGPAKGRGGEATAVPASPSPRAAPAKDARPEAGATPPAAERAFAAPAPKPAADEGGPPRASGAQPPQRPALDKGVKVCVLSGPFAGKVGVVGDLDGRGGARVLLGLLSARIEVAHLETVMEGRERPALQSSHRKPAAPAPRKTR